MLFCKINCIKKLIFCWLPGVAIGVGYLLAATAWAQQTTTTTPTLTKNKSEIQPPDTQENKSYSVQLKRQQILAPEIQQHEVIWLDTSIGKWLSLYHQDETGKRKGILIIVPDDNLGITQSATLNKLSLAVPQTGWSSWIIAMPHQQTISNIKARQEDKLKRQEAYTKLKIEILQQAINQVPTKDKTSIFVLLHGNNFQLFNRSVLDNIHGVILLNLIDIKEKRLADSFSELTLSILEIAGNKINHLPLEVLKHRKSVAKSSDINYRQIIYPTADLNFSHLELILSRTITGWLNKLKETTDK